MQMRCCTCMDAVGTLELLVRVRLRPLLLLLLLLLRCRQLPSTDDPASKQAQQHGHSQPRR